MVDRLAANFAGDGTTGNQKMDGVIADFGALTTEKALSDAVESTLPAVSGGIAQLTNISTNVITDIVAIRQDVSRGLSSGDVFMANSHIWFKPFGGWTEQNNTQDVTGYDIQSHGLAVGMDGDITDTLNVGVALTYMSSDVESKLASGFHTVSMDSYMAKVYATHLFDDDMALNVQVGGGVSHYDSRRLVFNNDKAVANYDSWHAKLSAELERTYQVSDTVALTPYVHADYSYVGVDRYTESDAGALNLTVDDDSADSFVIGFGVKGKFELTDQLSLSGIAGIGYDAMAERTRVTSAYAGGGAMFSTNGIKPDEIVYKTGVNLKYSLDDGSEMTASYAMDARQGYTDQSASLNIRILF